MLLLTHVNCEYRARPYINTVSEVCSRRYFIKCLLWTFCYFFRGFMSFFLESGSCMSVLPLNLATTKRGMRVPLMTPAPLLAPTVTNIPALNLGL